MQPWSIGGFPKKQSKGTDEIVPLKPWSQAAVPGADPGRRLADQISLIVAGSAGGTSAAESDAGRGEY